MSSDKAVHQPNPGLGAPGTTREHHEHHELGFLRKYIFSTDHKVIGLQFMFTGLVMLGLGGALAMAIRWQLAWPWTDVPVIGDLLFPATGGAMSPEFYTMLFTMHGTIMIFFVIIPMLTGAFGNFLIPLMIGAPDMAFPKLNMLSYWTFVLSCILVLASFTKGRILALSSGFLWASLISACRCLLFIGVSLPSQRRSTLSVR